MVLFLTLLFNPANAAACSFRNLAINQPKLVQYAQGSQGLTEPKLFRTEGNPEFDPDNPTTFWALPTTGSTVQVKVRHATAAPVTTSGAIGVVWIDTVLTIDPVNKTVSGADECNVLYPITERVLEILQVIQASDAAN